MKNKKKKGEKEQAKEKSASYQKKSDVSQGDAIHKTKIRVIGIGGGGGAIVSEIASRIKKADFYIANTDNRSLAEPSKKVKKFQFGLDITKGFGTGMNSQLGEEAALAEKERIEKILENQDLCIIIACLGGGTSSGAAPVFAKIAKKMGNLTYGIFTLPFEFEGEKKMEAAYAALEKIKPDLNIYTVIPNERIFEIVDKDAPLKSALSVINNKLADNLEGLIEMIYLSGVINIDFADLKTILYGRGRLAYLNTIETEEPQKEEAIKELISSSIYPYTSKGAKGILYNITSGNRIQLSEIVQISNIITESVSRDAKIIFGISQKQKQHNKIKIVLLATGCSGKPFLEKSAKKPVKKVHHKNKAQKIPAKKKKMPKKEIIKKIKPKKERIIPKKKNKQVSGRVLVKNLDDGKVRRNALQVRKDIEQAENDILENEKVWDVPAILRKKDFDNKQ